MRPWYKWTGIFPYSLFAESNNLRCFIHVVCISKAFVGKAYCTIFCWLISFQIYCWPQTKTELKLQLLFWLLHALWTIWTTVAENAVKVLYVFVLGQSRLLKDVDYVAPLFPHMLLLKSWPLRQDNFGLWAILEKKNKKKFGLCVWYRNLYQATRSNGSHTVKALRRIVQISKALLTFNFKNFELYLKVVKQNH